MHPARTDKASQFVSTSPPNPVAVVACLGGAVECRHRSAFALADRHGRLIWAKGNVNEPVFPRSTIKPIQALPLIESGAADRFGLGDEEIALACASHSGEARHVAIVESWLQRLSLTTDDLECGPHAPLHENSARRLVVDDIASTPAHNNCSGKHCGFLTIARHIGAPVQDYSHPDHPVQIMVGKTLAALAGFDLRTSTVGVDGCGVPTWAMPLSAIATAIARLADPTDLPPRTAIAARRILTAMATEPHLIAGSGRLCTVLAELASDRAIIKVGAQGTFVAMLMVDGFGLALKIDDGSAHAARVALIALLQELGVCSKAEIRRLTDVSGCTLRNRAGRAVGEIVPVPGWAKRQRKSHGKGTA